MIDFWTGRAGRLDQEDVVLADVVEDLARRCSRWRTRRPPTSPARRRGSGAILRGQLRVGVAACRGPASRPRRARSSRRRRSPAALPVCAVIVGAPSPRSVGGRPVRVILVDARAAPPSPARKTAMPATVSPSLRRMTMTPRAALLWRLTLLTSVRTTWPLGADEQQLLVRLVDELDRRHVAGLGALERDEPHALAAAVLGRNSRERDALAMAGLGEHEECPRRAGRRPCPRPGRPCGRGGCR